MRRFARWLGREVSIPRWCVILGALSVTTHGIDALISDIRWVF